MLFAWVTFCVLDKNKSVLTVKLLSLLVGLHFVVYHFVLRHFNAISNLPTFDLYAIV